ncbi:hypothetical protein GPB2148_2369 [marine gamma proteobacterium HTCC2148]|nr:hypothetical protein GPB2148_2369 [marine gamma proteobacterium HTCC2148]
MTTRYSGPNWRSTFWRISYDSSCSAPIHSGGQANHRTKALRHTTGAKT